MAELITSRGPVGLLDSLAVELKFNKTEAVERLLVIFLEKYLQMPGKAAIVGSFRRVNLELSCLSSHQLSDYPKVKLPPLLKSE